MEAVVGAVVPVRHRNLHLNRNQHLKKTKHKNYKGVSQNANRSAPQAEKTVKTTRIVILRKSAKLPRTMYIAVVLHDVTTSTGPARVSFYLKAHLIFHNESSGEAESSVLIAVGECERVVTTA